MALETDSNGLVLARRVAFADATITAMAVVAVVTLIVIFAAMFVAKVMDDRDRASALAVRMKSRASFWARQQSIAAEIASRSQRASADATRNLTYARLVVENNERAFLEHREEQRRVAQQLASETARAEAERRQQAWIEEQRAEEQRRREAALAASLEAERRAEEQSRRREAEAAHESAVREMVVECPTNEETCPTLLASILPLKKNERALFAVRARAEGRQRDELEDGTLVITNQRVHWNYDDPARSDIVKTWRGISRWYEEGASLLVIEWGSGKPLQLRFESASRGTTHDARVVVAYLNRASRSS